MPVYLYSCFSRAQKPQIIIGTDYIIGRGTRRDKGRTTAQDRINKVVFKLYKQISNLEAEKVEREERYKKLKEAALNVSQYMSFNADGRKGNVFQALRELLNEKS